MTGFLFSLSDNFSPLGLRWFSSNLKSMDYKSYKDIPNSLRKYRRIRGMSQKQVAKILGLKSAGRISLWESGVSLPSLVSAIRLAALYRTMVDGLFGDHIREIREEIHSREKAIRESKSK